MTAEVDARLGEGSIDARTLAAEPISVVQRVLARRIAAAGGKDESQIGLEKIEALAARLCEAVTHGDPLAANVGGALVRVTAEGRLDVVKEPARRKITPPRHAPSGPQPDARRIP